MDLEEIRTVATMHLVASENPRYANQNGPSVTGSADALESASRPQRPGRPRPQEE